MKKLLFACSLLIAALSAKASVWESTQEWDKEWEARYGRWIARDVSKDIFVDGKTLLSGMATDCADSLYAVRILFAYENNLPFVINAPGYFEGKIQTFGNATSMFDHIKDEKERVKAFIKFVMEQSGTDSLQKDTYPVAINSINAGTLYLVEWWYVLKLKMVQHSFFVKGANAKNGLIYLSSNAPVKVRKLDVTKGVPRFEFARAPFGYRAWKHPEHLLIPESSIPKELGYSTEQYDIVNQYGERAGLKEINKRIKKRFK